MQSDLSTDKEELLASGRVLTKRLESLRHAAKARAASVDFQEAIEGAMAALERGIGLLGDELGSGPREPASGSALIAQRMLAAVTEQPAGADAGRGAPAPRPASAPAEGQGESARDSQLRGTTDVLSVPDLLELLGSLQKTGVLEIATASEVFRIELRLGRLVHATTNHPPKGERLGDILVRLGYVTETHLEAFVHGFIGSGRKLGEVLESGSLVTTDQLAAALADQVQRLFVRLYAAEFARFDFTALDEVTAGGNQKVELGLRQLLFESARISDEQTYA